MKREQQSLELMRALDAEQDTQRLKMGDSLSTPRPIDHFLYFRSKPDADKAAADDDDVVLGVRCVGHGSFLRMTGAPHPS